MRKPFDVPAEGLVRKSRGDSLCTLVNETVGSRFALAILPQTIEFSGDAVLALVKSGLYSKRRDT